MNNEDKRAIKAVLFDFGGVVAEEGFRDGLKAIAICQGLDPEAVHRAGIEAVYHSRYVLGKASETDFWQLMRERTGLCGQDEKLTNEILSRFVVRPCMLELARTLRHQGLLTAILSDQTDWLNRLDARDKFSSAFDYVFNSYHLGKGKRDPTLFDDIVQRLSIRPAQAVFVDDAPDNVERAHVCGLHALLYRDCERLEYELDALLGTATN
jgi:putative hydrolase of the HAD superfamily